MVSLKFSIILLSLLSLAIITQAQDPTFLYNNCPNATTYTRNSTYQANLNLVLSSLSSNATRSNISGFYNVSAGQAPDVLYGMFLCRGDVNNSVCQSCVNFATKDVLERCPIEKVAMIWYDECALRYSNRNIFSTVDQDFTLFMMSPNNVTVQPDRFDQLVANTLYMAARAASAGSGAKKFAVQQADYTLIQNLYTLVQCTPDLSTLDCRSCLDGVISKLGNCCNRKQGGRVIFASCNFRYELYEFYNATAAVEAVPAPPPVTPSPPPASGSKTSGKGKKSNTTIRIIVIIVVPAIGVMILVICIYTCLFIRTRKQSEKERAETMDEIESAESLQFAFSTIRDATQDFLEKNRLGQGGFGVVYKGVLPSGQEIAVKRLSKDSGQGDLEFKNEVLLVAKLQHRNLVRLLGFCLQGIERLLIYEFVPNASLDHFIFDPTKRVQLNWERRYKIIGGIARGLLYLHEDSRIRIIHRDLKASNILLDEEMNPKISDFGMARLFVVDQTQGNTSRIVGTYGYMAPEYALQGHFSVKLDVFSFGVLALEIVTGKKNSFRNGDDIEHLISHAWRNWKEGTAQDIIDPVLSSGSATEMMRCIHIGLLCVQENIADRPTMASVVLMLSSSSLTLQIPSQPAFFMSNNTYHSSMSSSLGYNSRVTDQSSLSESERIPLSKNEVSISELYPR